MPLPIEIQAYIDDGIITLERALRLTNTQRSNLRHEAIHDLIAAGRMTLDAALSLGDVATCINLINALSDEAIRARVYDRTLHVLLASTPEIQDYVDEGIITLERALGLYRQQKDNLRNEVIRDLITVGKMTVDAAIDLEQNPLIDLINALSNEAIRARVYNGTLDALLASTPEIQDYVDEGIITLERALSLYSWQKTNLRNGVVRDLIAAGRITVETAINLTYDQQRILERTGILELLLDDIITLTQAFNLTENTLRALRVTENWQRLRDGDLAIDDIIGNPILQQPAINDGQSTHHTSVHRTASESALRLAAHYKSEMTTPGFSQNVKPKELVDGLPEDSEKYSAAKRCVLRITDPGYQFSDPDSHITTRELLALSFLAISDDQMRTSSFEEAKAQFIEALYEIQRGYNLSEDDVDQGGPDRPICCAGTFNKFIEKLQGVHPCCKIEFISHKTASFKLPIVVREEAMRYITSLSNPDNMESLRAFTHLVSLVEKRGVEAIWGEIKDKIADRMFDEFGCLYRDKNDPALTDMVSAGVYSELPELSLFQKHIQGSKGYHQFCSRLFRQPSMLSPHQRSAEYLSQHRHDSPNAQREYDLRFGLVSVSS